MEYSKDKWRLVPKIALLGGILLALFVAGYYSGYLREDCEQDKKCFDDKLKECKPAQVTIVRNNNAYLYWIGNSLGNNCVINIKLLRVEAGSPPEFKRLLEGKSMKCKIPKKELANLKIEEFDNLMQYCHGELKEGLYELIIERMYSLVVSQLGDIIQEAEKVLKEI